MTKVRKQSERDALPPSPWHVDKDSRHDIEWNNHILSDDGKTVCFMAHNPDDNAALENAASVIAASPLLFDMANQTVECLTDHWGTMDNMPADFETLYRKLTAVIALAERY